jgi:hypothetical protein
MFKRIVTTLIAVSMLVFLPMGPVNMKASGAETNIKLIVDGNDITEQAAPVIVENRVLVPVRFVVEELGAQVSWNGESLTVEVNKGDDYLKLIIDSRLVQYDHGETYELIDVAPMIINDLTYVPLRIVGSALGIGIEWDDDSRTVYVDSDKSFEVESFYGMDIVSLKDGQTINGKTDIRIEVSEEYKDIEGQVRILLLDGDTATGFIKDRGSVTDTSFTFIPGIKDNGHKLIAGVLYDEDGEFVAGDVVSVTIEVQPEIDLPEIEDYSHYQDSIEVMPDLNFLAEYVEYEFWNEKKDMVFKSGKRDPYGSYTWSPFLEEAGEYTMKATAFDSDGNSYESREFNVTQDVERELYIKGVSDDMTVDKPLTLAAGRNFDVTDIQYIIKNPDTGEETLIAKVPYGGYEWFPSVEDGFQGEMEVITRVKDIDEDYYDKLTVTDEILLHDFESLDGLIFTQYPDDSQGRMALNFRKVEGESSVKLSYDFTTMIFDDQSIAFIELGENGMPLDGQPDGISMWVYGDQSDHWLRCRIYDADGYKYKLDFADEVDWHGWKKVTAVIPDDVTYPVMLKDIYIAEIEYEDRDKGGICIDSLTADYIRPLDSEEIPGNYHDSSPVKVIVDGSPKLLLRGIGPGQVVTKNTDLYVSCNMELDRVEYYMVDLKTGVSRFLGESDADSRFEYVLDDTDAGEVTIYAKGYYEGKELVSDEVQVEIYTREIYSSQPVIEKSKFMDLASEMAVDSYERTGMSAALQTAQAILETGWGQYVPVDKYSGEFSNNLFGIKGSASNGSVLVNTWEVYNGVYFRVDDYFRAYKDPYESWKDHKSLLLEKERYGIFRDVMHDYILGAYAIRRAGYATDPEYPAKLINIIEYYDLYELDRVSI